MSQRLYSFLVVFLLMFCGRIFAQQKIALLPLQSVYNSHNSKNVFAAPKYKMSLAKNLGYNDWSDEKKYLSFSLLPASFNTQHLGFFCKKELQLDKITVVSFRFRLGSLAYVNYLEQKPNAGNPLR